MVLRIQCPGCSTAYRLQAPFPPEGKRYRCACGTVITVAYPPEVKAALTPSAERPAGAQAPSPRPAPAPHDPETAPTERLSGGAPRVVRGAASSDADPGIAETQRIAPADDPEASLTARPRIPPMSPPPPPGPSGFTAPPRIPPLGLTPPPRMPPLGAGGPSDWAPPRPQPPPMPPPGPETQVEPEPPPAAPPPRPVLSRSTDPSAERPAPPPEPDEAPPITRPRAGGGRVPPPRTPRPRRSFLRVLLVLVLVGLVLPALALALLFLRYSRDLPSVDSLRIYEPPVGTVVHDAQGRFVGEFFEEQRYVVAYDQIPEMLRNAFVAAEDASFYEHGGLDYLGIVRAMLKNVQEGRMAQGASTITQQVARSFLLSREKKLERKIKEAILASRIENNFDKPHILYLYLNQIFLGHGAYGVQAAAHLYFGKDVQQLTLAECAIIAGLPQAPSNYSPNRNFEAAKARQRYVLDQMAKRGYITQAQADEAYAAEMTFVKKRERNLDIAPYYVEHVRRWLFDATKRANGEGADPADPFRGQNALRSGLDVTVPIDIELQLAANAAVQTAVRRADKFMGWRGVKKNLDGAVARKKEIDAIDRERSHAVRPYHPAFHLDENKPVPADVLPGLQPNEVARAVVARVEPKWALVDVGSHRGVLPVDEFEWCHSVNPNQNFKFFKCRTIDDVLKVGDVISIRVVKTVDDFAPVLPKDFAGTTKLPRLAMEQDPAPQSALMSIRVSDGAVLAMVGGSNFEGNEFNRAIQAKRQVGSTFKPLVFAAAFDSEDPVFTPSTIVLDAPIVEEMTGKEGELWKPANSGDEYLGETTLRRGLILSRNIVTLKICMALGMKYTVESMKRFGFETPVEPNLASCLGATAMTMLEMIRAYSVFASQGDRREPNFVTEVRDRRGTVLFAQPEGAVTQDVMEDDTAYLMEALMLDVVRSGTARLGLEVGVPVAGKTGTTNEFRDAWFIGFTPEVLTGIWVGLDEFRSMGRGQFGGEIALPSWVEYMKEAVKKYPATEHTKPPDVTFVRVDSLTGLLARDEESGVPVPFKRGTEPTKVAPAAGQVDAADFLSGEY